MWDADHVSYKKGNQVQANHAASRAGMTEKTSIVKELGEEEILLPGLVNAALIANDRIKYYFTLLQTVQSRIEHPDREFPNLRTEREIAQVENALLDNVVIESRKLDSGTYRIPYAGEIFSVIKAGMHEMLLPIQSRGGKKALEFKKRLTELLEEWPDGEEETLNEQIIPRITSGNRSSGDSLHLLVMDMHRALNALQRELSQENIDGAMTYMLEECDKVLVRAFMAGVNRTAPLKFDHPGLGTTATRTNRKLVIQNDIGLTDAHVLVVSVEEMTVSIVYTDIHMPRLQFFQSLFNIWDMKWEDTLSKRGGDQFEKELYHLSTGRYKALNTGDLQAFLTHLGSRIVFLIDWNRARKRLRNFLRNKDCITVLKWAADNDVGHVAFLNLGGEKIIYEALELAARVPLRYGEPLHQILGRDKSIEYLQWVLKTATNGLLSNHSRLFIQDEIKAELLRYFRSAHEGLMEVCEEHGSFMIEVAAAVRDSLLYIQRGGDTSIVARNARRAKIWESQADQLVRNVRSLSRRIEAAEFFAELIEVSDDVLDYLEEACFFTTLIPSSAQSRETQADLSRMAEIAVRGSQAFLTSIIAAQYVHKGYSREDMQDFLRAFDQVIGMERECDEALRETERTILRESMNYKEFRVYFELASNIEESTNSLMKAVYIIRDNILESVNR